MTVRRLDFRTLPLLLAATLVLALLSLGSCGGEELVIDEAALAKMDTDEFQKTLTEASDRLVDRHGGDEAAFYAVFIALDQGYDACQLLTAALNDRLEADGRITDTEGAVLVPARPAEGLIQDSGDSDDNGADARAPDSQVEPVLLASLAPVSMADASTLIGETKVLVGFSRHQVQQLTTIDQLFDGFKEVREGIRKREAQEEEEQEKRKAALADEFEMRVLTELAARGYSAQQIAQAAVLLRTNAKYQSEVDAYVWDCMHSSGVLLRPIHEPVTLSDGAYGPTVAEDAPADYDPEDIEAALADGGEAGSTPGEDANATTQAGATNTPPVAEDIITSTVPGTSVAITLKGSDADGDDLTYTYDQPANGVAEGAPPFLTYTPNDGFAGKTDSFTYRVNDGKADSSVATVQIEIEASPDLDGIENGLYLGEVYVITKPEGVPVWEVLDSPVELEVTDEGITVTVEYVHRYSARGTLREATCIATIRQLYFAQGPVTDPLSLVLEPVEQKIISIEGSDCGSEGWDHSVEEMLLSGFAKKPTLTLAGTFGDGLFEGNMNLVLGVRATIAQ